MNGRGDEAGERKVRGGEKAEKKEKEWERAEAAYGGGGYTLSGAPCGGIAGIQERWR